MRLIDADTLKVIVASYMVDGVDELLRIIDAQRTISNGEWKRVEDKLPPDNMLVIGWVAGSDLICPRDGETLTEAIERTQREVQYPVTCSHDEEGWTDSDGYPMIVRPVAWTEIEAYRYETD